MEVASYLKPVPHSGFRVSLHPLAFSISVHPVHVTPYSSDQSYSSDNSSAFPFRPINTHLHPLKGGPCPGTVPTGTDSRENMRRMPDEKYKLVLVEDSEDDALLFELSLRRAGLNHSFEILRRFQTGETAIDYFSQPPSMVDSDPRPDIVIVDVKLPGRTGLEVLESIHELNPKPIIAIFTSSSLQEHRQKAHELGADVFQTKVFEPAQLTRFLNWLTRLVDDRRAPEL